MIIVLIAATLAALLFLVAFPPWLVEQTFRLASKRYKRRPPT